LSQCADDRRVFVGSAIQITFDPKLPCPVEAQGTIKVV
jgi:hypothetical protein